MKPTLSKTQRIARHARGYTLIEILVVAALIIVLMGILVGAGRKMQLAAKRSHTKTILNVCKSAAVAYETKFKPILHADPDQFTNNPSTIAGMKLDYATKEWDNKKFKKNAPNESGTDYIDDHIERFVYLALKYETSKKILKTLNQKHLIDRDGDGFLEVCDGFDNMIDYAAFVSHQDDYKGTYKEPKDLTKTQGDDALPIHKTSFFTSAGIDGLMGDNKLWDNGEGTETDANNDGDDDAKDNLNSFDQD